MKRGRYNKRTAGSALLSVEDWILLILLACLGLVWSRILFLFTAMSSACAEQYAVMGYVETGWLAGHTIWSMLFWVTCLSAAYAQVVIITFPNNRLSTLVFRILILSGFLLLAVGFRMMMVHQPVRPDGQVMINWKYDPWDKHGGLNPDFIKFETLHEYFEYGRPACLLVRNRSLVLPKMSSGWRGRRQHVFADQSTLEGLLIEAHKDSQVYIPLSDQEVAHLQALILPTNRVYGGAIQWDQITEKTEQ